MQNPKTFDALLAAAFEAGQARETAEIAVEQNWVMADHADEVAPGFDEWRANLST